MNQNILYLFILFFAPVFFSCRKFLEEQPNKNVVVAQSISELQALLDNTSRMNFQVSPGGFGESSADDYYLTEATYNSQSEVRQNVYKWQHYNYNFGGDWSSGYLIVYNANYCLELLVKTPATVQNKTQWNNVYGSALFFRGYSFLNLLWTYAHAFDETTADLDKGIVLRTMTDFNVALQRASVRECYQHVIEDARTAASYLPDMPVNVMRPSKAAAYGLLARAFLSMRKYDSAYYYANLCLNIYDKLMDFNDDPHISNGEFSFKPYNKEIVFYTELNAVDAMYLPVRSNVDTILVGNYSEGDLRKLLYFSNIAGHSKFKGSYAGNNFCFSGIATDEMYLIRAEAMARLGNNSAALEDLNILLKTRWNKNVIYTGYNNLHGKDLLSTILKERRKELLFRGLRWIDIKRQNRDGENITIYRKISDEIIKLPPGANYYAFPLPEDVVRLGGLEQN